MWMWSSLSRGAKAVNVYAWYPMSSGYESGGFGLINLDGTVTERARAAGAVARTVTANSALFANAKPVRAEVAIVYNPLSYMVGGRRPQYSTAGQSEIAGIEHRSMLGTFRALFPTNVPVDFVHIDEIAAGQLAGPAGLRYKVVFLPYPLMLPTGAGKPLRDFVAAGGTLVTEARPAWNDEQGKAREIIPGYGLNEVCGCRETAVHSTVTGKTEMELTGAFAGLESGAKLRGALFEETLEPTNAGAKVLARFADGTPAMVANSFGKGKMLAIGTFIGTRFELDRDENLAKFLRGVLDWSGVKTRVTTTAPLEVRLLRSGASTLVFAFNHATEPVESSISIEGLSGKVRDVETGAAVEWPLKRRFAPDDVWVLEVK